MTCPFPGGIPHTPLGPEEPMLWFTQETSPADVYIGHWAIQGNDLNNPIPGAQDLGAWSGPAPTLVCSVHGGCKVVIHAEGLSSDLLNTNHATVTVCGQICEFDRDDEDSTDLTAACWIGGLPDLPDSNGGGRRLQTGS